LEHPKPQGAEEQESRRIEFVKGNSLGDALQDVVHEYTLLRGELSERVLSSGEAVWEPVVRKQRRSCIVSQEEGSEVV
jgi:hypothetical protein